MPLKRFHRVFPTVFTIFNSQSSVQFAIKLCRKIECIHCLIPEISCCVNKEKQNISVFRAAETISQEKVQETQNILQEMLGKGQRIEKLDVLDNATLIADVRKEGKLIYVDFGNK